MTGNRTGIETLVMRMQADFIATPTLNLSLGEAERRFELDRETCEALLDVLVDATVLARTDDGAYRRFFPPAGVRDGFDSFGHAA
jgi:hypothetical protein